VWFIKKLYLKIFLVMKKLNLLFLFSLILVLTSCKTETKDYTLQNIEFTIEGPLFEGSNTGQYEVEVDVNKIQSADKINGAKFISCQLTACDSSDFSNVSGFVLQLTGENSDMTEIALLNQVTGGTYVQLKPSADKDISSFFKQNKFILLMDTYLKKDQEKNLKFKANIVFEIKLNQ
jgi:hypothetical protein